MNYVEMNNNKAIIAGKMVSEPKLSHEIFGEKFYEFDMEVRRLSDSSDIIPVTLSEKLMEGYDIQVGNCYELVGQFRSYNKLEEGKSRLMLTMFVRSLAPFCGEYKNEVEVVGYLCKEPIYRTTPFKREICDVLIAVNRSYNKSDYLPCIAWGRNARFARNFMVGDKVKVSGRIQSRIYQKHLEDGTALTKTAYELSLSNIQLVKEEEIKLEQMQTSIGQVDNYFALNV